MTTATTQIKIERLFKFDKDQPLKAFVDVNINDQLLIKSLMIVEGKNGLFVSMPREQSRDNRWYDSVRCIDKDLREELTGTVLRAYQETF